MISTTIVKPQTLSNHLLAKERSYYRSKVFNTSIGINPLIAAAAPLFSLATFLLENIAAIDTYTLFQDLQHEIKAFENNAKMQRYRSETILVTRYLLCAFMDEIILYSPFAKTNEFHQHSLLMFFHQETEGSERFFVILERLSNDPELHIDLLELIYLCLNFGYLGKYRHEQNGKEIIDQITKRLFECIRLQREELKKELHIAPPHEDRPYIKKIHLPLWLIISFTFAVLLTIYSSFSYMLGNNAETLYQEVNALLHPLKNENP
jgi:type VI secretion system protein ImpK